MRPTVIRRLLFQNSERFCYRRRYGYSHNIGQDYTTDTRAVDLDLKYLTITAWFLNSRQKERDKDHLLQYPVQRNHLFAGTSCADPKAVDRSTFFGAGIRDASYLYRICHYFQQRRIIRRNGYRGIDLKEIYKN